jgi:hypothetical protein
MLKLAVSSLSLLLLIGCETTSMINAGSSSYVISRQAISKRVFFFQKGTEFKVASFNGNMKAIMLSYEGLTDDFLIRWQTLYFEIDSKNCVTGRRLKEGWGANSFVLTSFPVLGLQGLEPGTCFDAAK